MLSYQLDRRDAGFGSLDAALEPDDFSLSLGLSPFAAEARLPW